MPAERTSTAHVFFDWIKGSTDPVTTVRSLIRSTPPTFETDHLDFKGSIDQGRKLPLPDEKIKEIWSEAVGGFANAGGGVLLWGIDCRKDQVSGIDAADKEILVPDVYAFQTKLKDWMRNANDPPVSEVEFLPVVVGNDAGFLACLIPQSRNVPHNCEYIKNKPYRMRTGDNFINIAPPLLRRMMYPQFSPALEFTGQASIQATGDAFLLDLVVFIENVGTATARDVFITVRDTSNDSLRTIGVGKSNKAEWDLVNPVGADHGFHGKRHLHPGMASKLHGFRWSRRFDGQITTNERNQILRGTFPHLKLTITGFAENMPPQHDELIITDQQVIRGELVWAKRVNEWIGPH